MAEPSPTLRAHRLYGLIGEGQKHQVQQLSGTGFKDFLLFKTETWQRYQQYRWFLLLCHWLQSELHSRRQNIRLRLLHIKWMKFGWQLL